jgi:hypothetical protein
MSLEKEENSLRIGRTEGITSCRENSGKCIKVMDHWENLKRKKTSQTRFSSSDL